MRQLTSTDWAMLSIDTPIAHNAIGIVGIYDPSTRPDGPVTYEEVLGYIGQRLHVAESFRERLVSVPFGLDRPWWVRDEGFDIEYHVRHVSLPRPGTWRQFCTQVARIHSRPIDLHRPPWELYLIEGLDAFDHIPEGAFSAFLRVHHAALDGVAGAEILTAIHTNEPNGAPPPPAEGYHWEPDRVPSDADLLRRAALSGLTRPLGVAKLLRPTLQQLPAIVRDGRNPEVTSPASLPAATRFSGLASPHRVIGAAFTRLDELKKVRTTMPEAKINDIGLAVVGGAMRSYLVDKGELPDDSLVAMMPISIRPTLVQQSKAIGPTEQASIGGNQFSIAPITMATDEEDPRDRLTRIIRSTAHVKESGAHPVRALMEMSEQALGGLMGTVQRAGVRALSRRGRTMAVHTLVSNVPGPLTPVYFCGARAVDTTGLGPVLDGMLLNNGIGSYDGRVTFCFTSDRGAMPDPEFYEACLSEAVDDLVAATSAKRRKPAT